MNMVTFILTPEEAQFVINQVATLPYNQVSGLVEKLVTQGRVSQQPQPAPPTPTLEEAVRTNLDKHWSQGQEAQGHIEPGFNDPRVSTAREVNC